MYALSSLIDYVDDCCGSILSQLDDVRGGYCYKKLLIVVSYQQFKMRIEMEIWSTIYVNLHLKILGLVEDSRPGGSRDPGN